MFYLGQIHRSIAEIENGIEKGPSSTLLEGMPVKNSSMEFFGSESEALTSLREAEIFEVKGIWQQAEEKYKESIAKGGGATAMKKLALLQLQRRKYDEAKETIQLLKEVSTNDDDLLYFEAITALRMGDVDTAQSILSRNPASPMAKYITALISITKLQMDEAKVALEKVASEGNIVLQQNAKSIIKAMNEFALFPHGQDAHLFTLVARALAEVHECETALQLLQTVLKTEGKYRDAWIVKGYCEFSTDRQQDALQSLQEAYSIDPQKPEIQYFLARTYAALGDPQNAVTFLQYAVINGFQPERDARQLLSEYARELGNIDLSLEQLKIIAEMPQASIDDFRMYITLATTTATHALDALEVARAGLAKWQESPEMLSLSAKAALGAGVPEDAKEYVNRALRLDPRNIEALSIEKTLKQ